MHVTGGRGQLGRPEIIARDEIGEKGLVAKLLAELEVLLALAEISPALVVPGLGRVSSLVERVETDALERIGP